LTLKEGPLALIILDGFGYSPVREGNAIELAAMPYYDELRNKYPHTLIEASGECVGLPPHIMGNSEVGHLNMGSGRVIRTDIARIDHDIESGEFFSNEVLVSAMDSAKQRGSALHLMGLLSDGLVHSSIQHLFALLRMASQRGVERVFVHCFLDGRDTPPGSAVGYIQDLQTRIAALSCGRIATLAGRYYAMDRDKRWDRTERAYRAMVRSEGLVAIDPVAAVRASYERGTTDEFVEPIVVTEPSGSVVGAIREGDAVICFNFRPDRARQITAAIAVPGFDAFPTPGRPSVLFACFTVYDEKFQLPVAFPKERPINILADVFAGMGIRNYRLAETEKYAHVTYFFNGGTEIEFPFERRLLVPSPKVATYDEAPEMSAYKITDKVLRGIDEGETDVFIINFANPDMVGHTGNLAKTVEAVQHVDNCLGWITKGLAAVRGRCIVTADHGKCEQMIDPDTGRPHTAHTTNPVPFHLVDESVVGLKLREGGALKDVAPTMLAMLGIEKPLEMTGVDLREEV
jgi:2,3-bisphosphoglycerate-independent phosphoglycerate mutase